VFRVLQGLSAGGGRVVGQAIVRDLHGGPAAQRLMSHITMVFGLAPAVAPVIGGYLQATLGWRSVFFFMMSIALILLVACYFLLPESLHKESRVAFHPATLAKNYWIALRHRQFPACALAVAFAFGGMALYVSSAASFVIHILHEPETAFAWLFLPMIGGMVMGSALGGRLAHRVHPTVTLSYGFACMAIAVAANLLYNALFVAAVPWAVLPIFVYTFGVGLAMPNMMLMALDLFPKMRGMASSLVNFVQMLVFSLISGVIAPLLFDSAMKLAIGELVCFVLAGACWWIGMRPGKHGKPD
jgi:DHA1 family bicyclomycin/chloramphenicol resistance-like MFS transporter